jgi:cbb3-type cytochrome oxidase subunit 3
VITNAFLLFAIIFVLMYAAFILVWAYVLSS